MASNKRWKASKAGMGRRTLKQNYGRLVVRFGDAEIFLLLSLSIMALIARLLSLGLSGMDEGMRGVLTHGLVILNGG